MLHWTRKDAYKLVVPWRRLLGWPAASDMYTIFADEVNTRVLFQRRLTDERDSLMGVVDKQQKEIERLQSANRALYNYLNEVRKHGEVWGD